MTTITYFGLTSKAKAHYAIVTTGYLESQNIKLVLMCDNPPKACPIENFWTNLYLKVYDKHKKTQLIFRIRNKFKKFVQKELQTLMKTSDKNSVK